MTELNEKFDLGKTIKKAERKGFYQMSPLDNYNAGIETIKNNND